MTPLTVAAVWVRGNVAYDVQYVLNLRAMVKRHLHRPFTFVCLTDNPLRLPHRITPIHIPTPRKMSGWWAKAELWQPRRFTGRVLYLDLDTLIVDALDPIVDFPASFALIPDAGKFQSRTHQTVKRFNSSVMVWDADHPSVSHLPAAFTTEVTKRLHGDQDVLGEQCPEAATMPLAWFPRFSELNGLPPKGPAKVVLCKVPKNAEAAQRWPWVAQAWGAAA